MTLPLFLVSDRKKRRSLTSFIVTIFVDIAYASHPNVLVDDGSLFSMNLAGSMAYANLGGVYAIRMDNRHENLDDTLQDIDDNRRMDSLVAASHQTDSSATLAASRRMDSFVDLAPKGN